MTYLTISGKEITGTIISRLSNTVVVADNKGYTHLVHNSDIGERMHGKHCKAMRRLKSDGFDLEESQRIGKTGYMPRKRGLGI